MKNFVLLLVAMIWIWRSADSASPYIYATKDGKKLTISEAIQAVKHKCPKIKIESAERTGPNEYRFTHSGPECVVPCVGALRF